MKINIPFRRKDSEIETSPCVIEKTVKLSADCFDHFSRNLLNDYDFILENIDHMYQDNDGVNHCLLVLCEEKDDGIIVESEGSSYARYSAYLPCARKLIQQEQYPSLTAHADEMRWLADKYVQKALNGQLDCQYRIDFDEVRNLCRHSEFSEELFMDMLSDRDEIDDVEFLDDGCTVTISELYLTEQALKKQYRACFNLNSRDEIEIICAKNTLWVHAESGGKQADFSDCLLDSVDLSDLNFYGAVFNGATLLNCTLKNISICFADFKNTKFIGCDMQNSALDESELNGAEFIQCNLQEASVTHCNFTKSKMIECNANEANFSDSCVDRWINKSCCFDNTIFDNICYCESEWLGEQDASPVMNI